MPLINNADALYIGASAAGRAYLGATMVWPIDSNGSPPAAPSIRSSAVASGGGTPWTATKPASVVVGDLQILVLSIRMSQTDATNDVSTPSGWTKRQLIGVSNGGNAGSMVIFTKTADGSEADLSIAQGGGLSRAYNSCWMSIGGWAAYADVAGASNSSNNASPVTITAPDITMAAANGLHFAAIVCTQNGSTYTGTPIAMPSGWTQVAQQSNSGNVNNICVAYKTETSAGATGTTDFTETGFAVAWVADCFQVTP